jgi:hypothetical protein
MLTPYQKRQKDEDFMDSIYTSDDFRSKKNSRKKKVNFQNVLVPKTNSMRKEEGATVAATPTFPHSGLTRLSFVGRKAVSTEEVQTIGKYS